MLNKNITIIIPIYNEGENIGLLIDNILEKYNQINILVVDDFSKDDSVFNVNNKIKKYCNNIILISKKQGIDEKGLTYSIIKGIFFVKTKYFIVMDGDFQHPIKKIQNFIDLFNFGKNIVIGERKKIIFKEKRYRILISKLGNFLINIKIRGNGFKLKDPLSGFFGGETIVFKKEIKKNKNKFIKSGYKFLFEFFKIIKKVDYNIGKFNFNFGNRKFGESKISNKIYIDFIKGLLK